MAKTGKGKGKGAAAIQKVDIRQPGKPFQVSKAMNSGSVSKAKTK